MMRDLPSWSRQMVASASTLGWARAGLACWGGNGAPRRRSVAGLRGRSATLGLRHGPDSYGRQQWGILRNGRKPDAATPRERRRPSGCKALSGGKKAPGLIAQGLTVPPKEATANYVPCLLYTSDAADDLLCVDLGGRRIIKKKKNKKIQERNS